MNKTCKQCGSELNEGHTYCSIRCANTAKADNLKLMACAQCGDIFKPTSGRSKYCSHECKELSRYKHNKVCAHCGESFTSTKSFTQYCSRICMGAAQAETTPKKPSKLCACCNSEFIPWHSNAKYCSHECAHLSRVIGLPPIICGVCGAEFTPITSEHKYCSIVCKKDRQSELAARRNTNPNDAFGNYRGQQLKHNGYIFKSSWELALALFMDKHNIRYEYEPQSFTYRLKKTVHRYTPDFYLPDIGLFLEVKPNFKVDDITAKKLEAVQSYGYPILLITEDTLNALGAFKLLKNIAL